MTEFIKRYNFTDYFVDDLIDSDTKIIFVLESPHIYEVKNGYPVAGKSGKDMSKILMQDKDLKKLSFGQLIYEKKISNFGILNVSNIPLQELAYNLKTDNGSFSALPTKLIFKDFILFRQNPSKRKKECRVNKMIDIFSKDFKSRLELHKDKKIVLCGAFVQKIFHDTFNDDDFKNLIEVPHPSFNNWSKEKYKPKIKELLEFIR